MKNYDLERKIYNALKAHVLHKPKLMSVVWENNGGLRLNFLHFTTSPKELIAGKIIYSSTSEEIVYPIDHRIEIEWPRQSDLSKLDPAFINKRMGYIAISPSEIFYG